MKICPQLLSLITDKTMKWHCIVNTPETWVYGEKVKDHVVGRQAQVTFLSEDKWSFVVGNFGAVAKAKDKAIKRAEDIMKTRKA